MKLFVVAFCVAVCSAAKLDNTYLPPGSARTAGGSGSFLSAPRGGSGFGGGSFGGKTTFGGGASFGSKHSFSSSGNFGGAAAAPAQNYGAPAGGNFRAGGGGGHSAGPEIPIVRFNNENNGDGTYRFEYETGNGIQAQEAGQQKGGGQEDINDVHGSFAYTGDDGQQYSISYVADENGFQPQGAHLPTPPPIPEEILKSLQDNAADEARGISDDGSYNAGAHGGAGGAGGYGGSAGHGGGHGGGYGSSNRGGSAHGGSFGGSSHGSSSFGGSFGAKQSGFGNAGANRQYLAPNKPSFNAKSGYNY